MITEKQQRQRAADRVAMARTSGNIEFDRIPKNGDVFDFGTCWAYRPAKGVWMMVIWSSLTAHEAHDKLPKLARATLTRLVNQSYEFPKSINVSADEIWRRGYRTPREIRTAIYNAKRRKS